MIRHFAKVVAPSAASRPRDDIALGAALRQAFPLPASGAFKDLLDALDR